MDQTVERRIRDRAYSIWEEEGCPTGRDVEHWMRACEEVAAEDGKSLQPQSGDAGPAQSAETRSAEKPKRGRTTRAGAKSGDGGAEAAKAETGKAEVAKSGGKTGSASAPKPRKSSKTT